MHPRVRQHHGRQPFCLLPAASDFSKTQKIEIKHARAPAKAPSAPKNPLNVQKVIHEHLRRVRTSDFPDTIEELWLPHTTPGIAFIEL